MQKKRPVFFFLPDPGKVDLARVYYGYKVSGGGKAITASSILSLFRIGLFIVTFRLLLRTTNSSGLVIKTQRIEIRVRLLSELMFELKNYRRV